VSSVLLRAQTVARRPLSTQTPAAARQALCRRVCASRLSSATAPGPYRGCSKCCTLTDHLASAFCGCKSSSDRVWSLCALFAANRAGLAVPVTHERLPGGHLRTFTSVRLRAAAAWPEPRARACLRRAWLAAASVSLQCALARILSTALLARSPTACVALGCRAAATALATLSSKPRVLSLRRRATARAPS